jgi:hypothetical protein
MKFILDKKKKMFVSDNTKQNSAQKGININIKVCAHF